MPKILYISTLCSDKVSNYILATSHKIPGQAVQKFHRLLAQGFALHPNECQIETLTSLPITPYNHNKKIWNLPRETLNNITYNYVPMLNVPFIKNIGVFLFTFFKVFFWSLSGKKQRVILCDILNLSLCSAAFFATKLTGAKNVTIVTDLPGNMVSNNPKKSSVFGTIYTQLISFILTRFSGYVLLTEQMNAVVNPKNRPYLVMEGLVDVNMDKTVNDLNRKAEEKVLIYAGGLYARYGIKNLIEAFAMVPDSDARLHLYGHGEMVKDMNNYTKNDPRLIYMGIVPNGEVVSDQLKATLLINPRPTIEEFTKYSFPSKNMEYMVSGTPMVTTKLPGMPMEYLDYVYLFEEENTEGIYQTLAKLLSKSREELHNFGIRAKSFVIKNKNNKMQAEKILALFQSING